MYEPPYMAGPQGLSAPRGGIPRMAFAVIAVAAIVLVVFLLSNAVGSCSQPHAETHEAVFKVTKEADFSYSLKPGDLLTISNSSKVEGTNLSTSAPAFTIGSALLAHIEADIASIEKSAPCGFVFMDVATGRAIAYNAGKTMYIASASKEPLVYYATTHPANGTSLDDEERNDVEEAIVWSDNDLYFDLCRTYFDDGYMSWLASYGIEHAAGRDDYFPKMSPNELGAVWAETLQYIQAGSDDARWLSGLLGRTEESYIRDGLAGTKATVIDKAGWMTDSEVKSVSDAGIVQAGGHTYLMAIVTEQSEFDKNSRQRVAQLARDLYDARGMLAPHIVVEV